MEMPKDLTLLDLIVLEKIENDSLMESFSGKLYSSFFDTASILGTLQVKQLVSISSSIGRSIVNKSELGEKVLMYAEEKASEPLDGLDHVILKSILGGNKTFEGVRNDLNIRSDDLAIHLYKVIRQGYADYEIRSGKLTLNVTEKGFKLIGYIPKKQAVQSEVKGEMKTESKTVEANQTKQLDIKSILSSVDATPSESSGEQKKLGTIDKFVGKASYFITKHAALLLISILALTLILLYLTGQLNI